MPEREPIENLISRGNRAKWTVQDRVDYCAWCRAAMLADEASWSDTVREEVRRWPEGRLAEARLAARGGIGGAVPNRQAWVTLLGEWAHGVSIWPEDTADVAAFCEDFFRPQAFVGYAPGTQSLFEYFQERFRLTPPYQAWAAQVIVRDADTLTDVEQAEIRGSRDLADTRVLHLIVNRDFDNCEVSGYVERFNKKAQAICRHFDHPPQDTEQLIQDFWLFCFTKRLFEKCEAGRTPTPFLMECFRNFFREHGRNVAIARAREQPLALPDGNPRAELPPVDALVYHQLRRQAIKRYLEDRVKGGRLIWEVEVGERTYAELSQTTGVAAGTLRKRVFDAIRKARKNPELEPLLRRDGENRHG